MSEVKDRPTREHPKECVEVYVDDTLTIDGDFLRDQAAEAVETFFAPLAGIVAAASGRRRILWGRRRKQRKAA